MEGRLRELLDLASENDCMAVLKGLYSNLTKRLTCEDVLPALYSSGVINDYEKQEIQDNSNGRRQNTRLLDFLLKKSKLEFWLFVEAIEEAGRSDLLELIKQGLQLHLKGELLVMKILGPGSILTREEFVILSLWDMTGIRAVERGKLNDQSIFVCFDTKQDRQKALEKKTLVIDGDLTVQLEEPDFAAPTSSFHNSTALQGATTSAAQQQSPSEVIARSPPAKEPATYTGPTAAEFSISPVSAEHGAPSCLQPCDLHLALSGAILSSSESRAHDHFAMQTIGGTTSTEMAKDDLSFHTLCDQTLQDYDNVTSCSRIDLLGSDLALRTGDFDVSLIETDAHISTCHDSAADDTMCSARLVLGKHIDAARFLGGQSQELQDLLKLFNCSVTAVQKNWGDLIVVDYKQDFTLEARKDRQTLCDLAIAVKEFFEQKSV